MDAQTRYKAEEGARELRYALEQAGWHPPHSFVLRNPDETRPRAALWRCEKDLLRYYEPSVHELKTLPREEILRRRREDDYRFFRLLNEDRNATIAPLHKLLFFAAARGYTLVESVRRSFSETTYMLSERRHWLMTTEQINHLHDDFHAFMRVPVVPSRVPLSPNAWFLHAQGRGFHLALVHTDTQGLPTRTIQYEDDGYLVHLAEDYLLYCFHRASLPGERWRIHTPENYGQLEHMGPEHLPEEGIFSCPRWLARIVERGYY